MPRCISVWHRTFLLLVWKGAMAGSIFVLRAWKTFTNIYSSLMQSKYIRHSYLFTQRADTTADPNFAEFCDWLEHHKWRRSTVTGAVAGMAAGAGMVGAKVSTTIKDWELNLE